VQPSLQDVKSSIVIAVHLSARGGDVCHFTKGFVAEYLAGFVVHLAGVTRVYGYHDLAKDLAVVFHPLPEDTPARVVDALSQVAPDHVLDFQVLKGNQVVGPDYAPRQLHGVVFALPLDFQMNSGQVFLGSNIITALLLSLPEPPRYRLVSFPDTPLGLAIEARVRLDVTVTVGVKASQAQIKTDSGSAWLYGCPAVDIHTELGIAAVSSLQDAHPLDLICVAALQRFEAFELQRSYPKPVTQGQTAARSVQLPACLLVLDATVLLLEPGVANRFHALLRFFIEPGNGAPSSFRRGLTGLAPQSGGKRVFGGKDGTELAEVILTNLPPGFPLVHPVSKSLVPDELAYPDALVYRSELLFTAVELAFQNDHGFSVL
jgi:hypothetical protein